jgi:hypothetical protein
VVINGALPGLVSQNVSPTIEINRNFRPEKEGGRSDWETTLPLLMYGRPRGGAGGGGARARAAAANTILGAEANESNLVACWQSNS